VRRYVAGTKDDFGNLQDTWTTELPWWVRSIDPVTGREPGAANRDLANIAYAIQADKTNAIPRYRDIVIVDGVEYNVDGEPDDWSRGPWANPVAGVTVYLRRTEG
jgi:hypothetical protein